MLCKVGSVEEKVPNVFLGTQIMEDKVTGNSPDENVTNEQLEEVAGGNSIHKRRLEQLETHDSSKSVKDINIQQVRLDALDTRDSSK